MRNIFGASPIIAVLLIAALLAASAAYAQTFSIWGGTSVPTPPPAPSIMLANTGSAILVNTGVKLLVQ